MLKIVEQKLRLCNDFKNNVYVNVKIRMFVHVWIVVFATENDYKMWVLYIPIMTLHRYHTWTFVCKYIV